ncbi:MULTISPECIES: glutathione S-transferase family protein [unclassified Mesorhizobium]|uniref:glutathione S-transferase family protein n=1 Tax=unclassified Mesorhizobium TaxID=325217 RepID=UPI00112D795A|nr:MULTISPECIES: glutathione S-transferase family protein [unclassified Mesorhizobium]TPL97996.1 glutathione S-transferase family protein [Mesorhizobium sp. B2-3-8]TPM14234.1 glutathione S-transferase family protein [Mesorhizobium sp. B2-3-7]
MGLLVEGKWQDRWYDTKGSGGKFVRAQSQWRDWITRDGAPAEGRGRGRGFKAEPGRYHLYVSLACPWAHRTLIFRALKKLEGIISVSVVHHFMGADGWTFLAQDGATGDTLYGLDFLHQIYTRADPNYSGRVTVPVLWDKRDETIVSNESSEIIRMLNSVFDAWGDANLDFYPQALRGEIDAVNALVYPAINNGVYRAGFATTQAAYEQAFGELFAALDTLEHRLSNQRYLVGERITEADWRLFTTLVRFDPVYVGHFKCNRCRIADYPNLSNYLRDLYQVPGVAGTVNLNHIKSHYYGSHEMINPTRIVPVGPELDYGARHDRARFAKAAA